MMRGLVLVALFACHVEAVKLTTGSPLQGMVKMLKGLIEAAQVEYQELEKECAEDITLLMANRDSNRADLNRYIGANNVPEKDNAGVRSCTSCGGEWNAHEQARIACDNEYTMQEDKAEAARAQMNMHKYNAEFTGANPGTMQCTDYTNSPPTDTDVSACATEERISIKQAQEASVAKQCKKTDEILQIALSIYKGMGGASFIQLAQEENLREEAKSFLESHEAASTDASRNAELLKLLHDFHQQVKRDCHQDMQDLKSDIHALNLHLQSKRNSAASEKRAYDTATARMHEADKCRVAEQSNRDKTHEKAFKKYATFLGICPAKPSNNYAGAAKDFQCATAAAADQETSADFACEWLTDDDRIHEDCQGSLMWKRGYCKLTKAQSEEYQESLTKGVATLNAVINGAPNSFIQLDAEKNAPAEKTALVQASNVDFSNLVSAISQAMNNEITKLNADASDVNAFADACEKALTPLDLPQGQELGGCTINAGDPCQDQNPLSDTCALCIQQSECENLEESAITAANNEAEKQDAQDAAQSKYQDAQASYAQAARNRSNKRAEWSRKKADYDENKAGLDQAKADLQDFADKANAEGNANAEAINNLMGVMQQTIDDHEASWTTYNDAETIANDTWNNGPVTNEEAKAYWIALTSMECTDANDNVALSHYCDMLDHKASKISFAAERSSLENQVFNDCTRTESTLNKQKLNLEARKMQCKIGVTKDLKEELHKMSEALQILQQAKTKIAGTA